LEDEGWDVGVEGFEVRGEEGECFVLFSIVFGVWFRGVELEGAAGGFEVEGYYCEIIVALYGIAL
jgi:hypothetical protein